jgi:pullulanase
MTETSQVQEHIKFCTEYKIGIVSYCIDGRSMDDSWKDIVLIFNGSRKENVVSLPPGKFKAVVKADEFNEDGIGEELSEELKAAPISTTILVKTEE